MRWKDEKARLDNIAARLIGKTNVEISILAFEGLDARKGTARALAKRARNYLLTKKRIKPEMVRILSAKDFVGIKVVDEMHLAFYINQRNFFRPH